MLKRKAIKLTKLMLFLIFNVMVKFISYDIKYLYNNIYIYIYITIDISQYIIIDLHNRYLKVS